MNEHQLMEARCDALFIQDKRSDLIAINDWLKRPAPAFWLGFTKTGKIWRFRQDVPTITRIQIEKLIESEAPEPDGQTPEHHKSYLSLLNNQAWSAGPAYWAQTSPNPSPLQVVPIHDASLLVSSGLAGWVPDIPHQQPMFGCVEGKTTVSICASVRRTLIAHEAGVETTEGYRRRGCAGAVVSAWAQSLSQSGIVPLYSTSWENIASQRVAKSLAFEFFGWDYSIGTTSRNRSIL